METAFLPASEMRMQRRGNAEINSAEAAAEKAFGVVDC